MPKKTYLLDALKGIVVTTLGSFVMVIVFAYLLRMPVPFNPYNGPFEQPSIYTLGFLPVVKMLSLAWVFYMAFGGFVILPVLGAVTGILVGNKYTESSRKNSLIVFWAFVVSAIPVFILSVLDWVIGNW